MTAGTPFERRAGNSGRPSASEAFWEWFGHSSKEPALSEPSGTDTRPSPSFGYAITGAATRRYPPTRVRREITAKQRNRCLYCGHRIGTEVWRDNQRVQLRANWDHFVPYVYARANRNTNWVLACHICNLIKSCHLFSTVIEAQRFIRGRLAEKGILVAPVIEGIDDAPVVEPIGLRQRAHAARPAEVEEAWKHVRCGLVRGGVAGATHVRRNQWTPLGFDEFEVLHRTSATADVIWYVVPGDPAGLAVAAAILRTDLVLSSYAISATFRDDEEGFARSGPLSVRRQSSRQNGAAA
ncbi:HNH endonuclease [Dactylosporangium sucinum]|uniref:HNH endonuclease n=1 Tax=Dactylosporangium sucinum TaxID=1424081 RepID=A0A917X1Q8_9ACTN|nr:hypothetical protein [Dactylosporangium sucinum]GGM53517.1 hypothetical protein GCM10007977_063890 [Dactylosporangium sucinum]